MLTFLWLFIVSFSALAAYAAVCMAVRGERWMGLALVLMSVVLAKGILFHPPPGVVRPFYLLRVWWARLWVRRDEFHWTLDIDWKALEYMTDAEKKEYHRDLVRRRSVAHERSL